MGRLRKCDTPEYPITDVDYWDARTARLLAFLTTARTHEELWEWAGRWYKRQGLAEMLAYLEQRGRAVGNSKTWIRIKQEKG